MATWTPQVGITQYPTTNVTPAQATTTLAPTAPTVAAATRSTNDNELVSSNLTGLLQADSPYLQQAQTIAKQAANKSGLLNTSMAAGAGTSAAIQAALPIAQGDAQAYQTAAGQNQANQQQTNLTNAQNTIQNNQFNASTQNQQSQFNTGQANQMMATVLDQNNKMQLADIEASYKTLMQADDAAFKFYQTTLQNITDIMGNANLTPAAKNTAVANQNTYLKNGLEILGRMNGIDFGNLLVFPTGGAA